MLITNLQILLRIAMAKNIQSRNCYNKKMKIIIIQNLIAKIKEIKIE